MSLYRYNAVLSCVEDEFQEGETIQIITGLDSSVIAANDTKKLGHIVPALSFAKLPVRWLMFWRESSRHVIVLVYHDWFIWL